MRLGDEAARRQRLATWLLALGGAQLLLKGATGGSVVFGGLAAGYAAWLMRPKAAFGGAVAALCGVAQVASCVAVSQQQSLEALPLCASIDVSVGREADVLGKKARAVPGVADAAAEGATVFVMPAGGGALPDATRAAVEQAIAGTRCAVFGASKLELATKFEVQPATYVEADVTATWHPGANRQTGEEPKIEAAVRRWFEGSRLHVADRTGFADPETPDVDGWVEYRVGAQVLRDFWFASKPGAVLTLRKLEVVKADR
jgi:hypothetical protein